MDEHVDELMTAVVDRNRAFSTEDKETIDEKMLK
jgi:hypothetical protein